MSKRFSPSVSYSYSLIHHCNVGSLKKKVKSIYQIASSGLYHYTSELYSDHRIPNAMLPSISACYLELVFISCYRQP